MTEILQGEGERLGNGMFVEVNGQRRLAPGDILPSNLWNRAILTEDNLHPILGKVLPLEVTKLGKREIETEEGWNDLCRRV